MPNCTHTRIKSVNCRLYCIDCGAELPVKAPESLQVDNNTTAAEKPTEARKTPVKRTTRKTK